MEDGHHALNVEVQTDLEDDGLVQVQSDKEEYGHHALFEKVQPDLEEDGHHALYVQVQTDLEEDGNHVLHLQVKPDLEEDGHHAHNVLVQHNPNFSKSDPN